MFFWCLEVPLSCIFCIKSCFQNVDFDTFLRTDIFSEGRSVSAVVMYRQIYRKWVDICIDNGIARKLQQVSFMQEAFYVSFDVES
jgi:hypothetical protein